MKKQGETKWFAKMNNNKDSKPPTLYLIGSPENGIWLTKEQLEKVVEKLYGRIRAEYWAINTQGEKNE